MNLAERNIAVWRGALSDIKLKTREKILEAIDLSDPPSYFDFVLDLFEQAVLTSDANNWLDSNLIVRAVTSPELFPRQEALQLAQTAARFDCRLDSRVVRHLGHPSRKWPESASEDDILHVLEVIDAISDCERIAMFLLKFVRSSHMHLRSKSVKLIARACRNPEWAKVALSDADARTRANLMEGLGRHSGKEIEALLRRGSEDPDPRVALNALLALSRNGCSASISTIQRLAADPRENFRRAAEWALRQLPDVACQPH